jgi:membrane-associated protease RseP (regulator of RpoE activity)
MSRFGRVAAPLCAAALLTAGFTSAREDKPESKPPAKADEKKQFDPKDVRVGPPPELAELRKAVEEAAKKGENVDEIRKQLDALEKALAGKAWVKPKPVEEPPMVVQPAPGVRPFPQPQPVPFPLPRFEVDPKQQEAMQKAQDLILKAAMIQVEDPAKAEELLKEAREILKGQIGGLFVVPRLDVRPGPAIRGGGARLGVRVEKVPAAMAKELKLPEGRGILAAEVLPGTAAEKAGLKADDVIVEIDGKPVTDDPTEFVRQVQTLKAGKINIVYYRDGKKAELKDVPLANVERPAFPGFNPAEGVPDPAIPRRGGEARSSKSVSLRVTDGNFVITAEEDGVRYQIEGPAGEGKPAPNKIVIFDGRKKVESESLEKVPAEYKDRVEKILHGVKLKK